MRVRVRNKVKRSERCVSRVNSHFFHTKQKKKGPEQIDELGSKKGGSQGRFTGDLLSSKAKPEMPDKHKLLVLVVVSCKFTGSFNVAQKA
jgi:hypothetical protein